MKVVDFALGLALVILFGGLVAFLLQAGLTALQSGGKVADSLNLILGGALAGLGFLYRSSREKRQQLENRLAAEKRDLYDEYVSVLRDVAARTSDGEGISDDDATVRLRRFAFGAMLLAADDAILAHIRFMRLASGEHEPSTSLPAIADVVLALRKDIGFPDTRLTPRQLLGVFITDIDTLTPAFVHWEQTKQAWAKEGFRRRGRWEKMV